MIHYKKLFAQYALLTSLAVFGVLALLTTTLAAEPKDQSSSQKPLDLPAPTDPEPYSDVPGSKVPPSVQSDPTIPGLPASPMPEPADPGLAPPPMPKPADPLSLS